MRHRLLPVVLLLLALATSAVGDSAPVPALAQTVDGPLEGPGIPVFPGLVRHELSFSLEGGQPEVANVLSFSADDELLTLKPVLGRDRVPGLETVPSMGVRLLDEGAVAGINGGFWLSNPVGDPNGFLAMDGALVSESQTQGAGPRGTFAIRDDGALLADRLDTRVTLSTSDGSASAQELDVTALNRYASNAAPYPDGDAPVFVYTPEFGVEVTVNPLERNGQTLPVRTLVVDGLRPAADGASEGTVREVETGTALLDVPESGSVVVAHGSAADDLADAEPGTDVAVRVEPLPLRTDPDGWRDLVTGMAAGPLIVAGGERTDPRDWESEGFAPEVHSNVRAPRSAIGFTEDGGILLVTVDGRQPGYASGMTMAELADFMISLDAFDALSLDGGGSTQLVTDGFLRNQPCCDADLRPVADGLFVQHAYDFTHSERLAGGTRNDTAAKVAAAGFPNGASEVLLAASGDFPDALAGGPLAAAVEGPLLLTDRDALPAVTLEALADLVPETVTVLGGVGAVGQEVETALKARGYAVRRLAGAGRISTATAIAEALGDEHPRVFLASAADFPDALTAGPPAGLLGAPVLLTGPTALPEETLDTLRRAEVEEVVVVGGQAAVGEGVVSELEEDGLDVTRLAGADRFATARAVNTWAEEELECPGEAAGSDQDPPCLDPAGLVVARGDAFPDALAGGPLAAARRHLLMIVPAIDVNANDSSAAYLGSRDDELTRVTLLGGHAGISSYEHWQLDQLAR